MGDEAQRRRVIDEPRPGADLPPVLRILLWVWVVAVIAGYLYQFRGLAAPLLKLIG